MTRRLKGLRGATTVSADDPELIRAAVAELLAALVEANDLTPDDILSAIFSATPDLRSVYPAAAARGIGWQDVPMLCVSEMDVAGALPRCVRIIMHAALGPKQSPKHVYLHDARVLRPDWVGPE